MEHSNRDMVPLQGKKRRFAPSGKVREAFPVLKSAGGIGVSE